MLNIKILSHEVSGRGRPDLPAVCPKVERVVPDAPSSGCPITKTTSNGRPDKASPPIKHFLESLWVIDCVLTSRWMLKIKILSHKVSGRGRPDLPAVCPKVGRVVPDAPPSGCPVFRLTSKGKPRELSHTKKTPKVLRPWGFVRIIFNFDYCPPLTTRKKALPDSIGIATDVASVV